MVTVENQRFDLSTGISDQTLTFDREINEALKQLIECELGFGGKVKFLSKDSIVTETVVLHKKDITVFSSKDEKEMSLLIGAIALWYEAAEKVSLDDLAKRAADMKLNTALLFTMGSGIVYGDMVKEKLMEMRKEYETKKI